MAKNVEVGDTNLEDADVPDMQKPRKPSSAYFYFVKKHRIRLQQQHPTWPMKRIISSVASLWSKTSQERRASFIELAEKDTIRYKNQVGYINLYNNLSISVSPCVCPDAISSSSFGQI